MTSTSDIFTTTKNIVTAINSAATSLAENFSNSSSLGVAQLTLATAGATRLVSFTILNEGTDVGYIYDSASTDTVKGYSILSALANGTGITINFSAGYTFAVGSTVFLKNTASVLDGAYIVKTSNPGTITALTTLMGNSSSGTVGSGAIVVVMPNTIGIYTINWPILLGIVIQPGTGQVVSVSWQ